MNRIVEFSMMGLIHQSLDVVSGEHLDTLPLIWRKSEQKYCLNIQSLRDILSYVEIEYLIDSWQIGELNLYENILDSWQRRLWVEMLIVTKD